MTLAGFAALAGHPLGSSSWIAVEQDRIDSFAQCTGDRQFIHVDPARAAMTPFGGTIAHGFLTLSLLSAMASDVMPKIEGAAMSINYGFNAIRFITPVKSGSRVRGVFRLDNLAERKPGHWLATISASVEIEDADAPALAAEWLTMIVMGDGGQRG